MYCPKCGNEVTEGNFCGKCGTQIKLSSPQQNELPNSNTNYSPALVNITGYQYAPGSFVEKLHSYGKSNMFLVGIILFSVAELFSIFRNFSGFSIFSLIMLALPVTGFWFIFAASKVPKMPEKTMTALTLFKVSIIIDLVLKCLAAFVMLIASFIVFAGAGAVQNYYYSSIGSGVMIFAGLVILLIAVGMAIFIIIYFRAATLPSVFTTCKIYDILYTLFDKAECKYRFIRLWS